MATIEDAIYTRTTTFGGLPALIGDRVFPDGHPQDPTLPSVAFFRISTSRPGMSHSGPAKVPSPRFQFSVMDATFDGALAVGNLIRQAWDGFKGTVAGVVVTAGAVDTEVDMKDSQTGLFLRHLDIIIQHEES